MADVRLSTIAGGVAQILMPQYVQDGAQLQTKTATGTATTSNIPLFYTNLELDFTSHGFDTATLAPVSDTLEQTIVDTGTGVEGVVTQIITGGIAAAGSMMTVRVTIDGTVTTFTAVLPVINVDILCIGDFVPWVGSTSSVSVAYGGGNNVAYPADLSFFENTMLSPRDSLTRGLPHGMVFKDSMKVTVQGSTNLRGGSTTHKAVVAWLTAIPEGLK